MGTMGRNHFFLFHITLLLLGPYRGLVKRLESMGWNKFKVGWVKKRLVKFLLWLFLNFLLNTICHCIFALIWLQTCFIFLTSSISWLLRNPRCQCRRRHLRFSELDVDRVLRSSLSRKRPSARYNPIHGNPGETLNSVTQQRKLKKF